MANAINIPKTHLIMGLSLPLAVLLGYFVAEPMELGSLAVVVFVLAALSVPLMMKWHHPWLVFCWNAALCPAFLPGRLPLWTMLAFVGLLFAVLNRAVSANARFVVDPSVTRSLLALTGVVVVTGLMTGGFGIRTLGGGQYGGRQYFYFLAAVAGYFVLTSRRIPPHRAGLYVTLFFLSGLTFLVADLAGLVSSEAVYVQLFFQRSESLRGASYGELTSPFAPITRYNNLIPVGMALYGYLLARFGIRGVLDLTRPWRLAVFVAALGAGLLSGFRVFVVLSALIFAILFLLEGLHRTRYLPVLLSVVLLGGLVVLSQAQKLPLEVQRALSVLPGNYDWVARESAKSSSEWRLGMWRDLLSEVPEHLFRGKGWGINARDFYKAVEIGSATNPNATTILAGDYHNGPLSVLIPFGLYGAVAFVWFLAAGLRVLHRNWKFGDPALRNVNAVLLAAFAARTLFFFFIFGGLAADTAVFAGLLGLSVALNGAGVSSAAREEQPATGVAFETEYVKA